MLEGFLALLTYFFHLNTILAISLMIGLELLKLAQSLFMQQDINLESNRMNAVEHIFTDKTETLTCNKMELKYCSVGEKIYGEINTNALALNSKENRSDFNCEEMQRDY